MENVLLPVNDTRSSDHAVDEIIHFHRSATVSIELHLLNVQWPDRSLRSGAYHAAHGFHPEAGLVSLQPAKDKLDQAGILYTCHVLAGDPVQAMPAYSEALQCQRIVMGCRAMMGWACRLFGSAFSQVVQQCDSHPRKFALVRPMPQLRRTDA